LIRREKSLVTLRDGELESETSSVKEDSPVLAGVPEMRNNPQSLRTEVLNPLGNEPELTRSVNGGLPPSALTEE
jgi:hypothetical protein